MKCIRCEHTLKTERGAHRYAESGLSDVTLVNVEIRTCPSCGEREIVIPKMEQLHRLMADMVIRETTRLSPERIKFLRKFLGFSAADFALIMGVRPETVSRWEGKSGYPIPPVPERLLRLLVANREPATQYPLDLFTVQPRVKPQPLKLRFSSPEWKRSA